MNTLSFKKSLTPLLVFSVLGFGLLLSFSYVVPAEAVIRSGGLPTFNDDPIPGPSTGLTRDVTVTTVSAPRPTDTPTTPTSGGGTPSESTSGGTASGGTVTTDAGGTNVYHNNLGNPVYITSGTTQTFDASGNLVGSKTTSGDEKEICTYGTPNAQGNRTVTCTTTTYFDAMLKYTSPNDKAVCWTPCSNSYTYTYVENVGTSEICTGPGCACSAQLICSGSTVINTCTNEVVKTCAQECVAGACGIGGGGGSGGSGEIPGTRPPGGGSCVVGPICVGVDQYYQSASCGRTLVETCAFGCAFGSCITTPGGSSAPDLSITTNPPLVRKNQTCAVSVSAMNVTSCSLSGPGISQTFSPNDSGAVSNTTVVSPPLSTSARYTLSCDATDGTTPTASANCIITPTFEEF